MGSNGNSIRQRNKKNKSFDCPMCGNELPCTNNKKIRCVYCHTLIQPQGYNNKGQQAFIIG